jgi:serine/threonine-protein kinase RsbW
MSTESPDEHKRRVLSRVEQSKFVGRADELRRIVSHPQRAEPLGLLLLLAPTAGVSELLRQAYDEIFHQHGKIIPVYFALPREETTSVSTAIEFLNTFLVQYLAFRRGEPTLCQSTLTLNDILALAPPADVEWMAQLVESYQRERFGNDDETLIRWCLSAPQRVPVQLGRPFVMFDAVALIDGPGNESTLRTEILRTFSRSRLPFLVAGLRRQMLVAVHGAQCDFAGFDVLRLDKLTDEDGRALVDYVARRQGVTLSEEVRDLLVLQFECSPFMITSFFQAATDLNVPLDTYLACEGLYVDELMGGEIGRYFSSLLESIAPDPAVRRSVIRLLSESRTPEKHRASFESWRRSLQLDAAEFEPILRALHVQEILTWDGGILDAGGGSVVWNDYLKVRYRLEIVAEPRALVVAETIAESLKRAPNTMARYYRRVSAAGLRDVLEKFDCQRIPEILLDYARFSDAYKGGTLEEMGSGLDADTNLTRLPQVVHVAACAAFTAGARQLCDEERCAVAHAFTDGKYTDANQVVWLAAEIDSKLEAEREVARAWWGKLSLIAREAGLGAVRIWLIAREGFSPLACEFLAEVGAYASSRQQMELLTARLDESRGAGKQVSPATEFEMVVPMGDDNELLVAHTVEEIARRLSFRPEAVNQIKHAVVEAIINASEHSLSPDRKIYQRFRVEDDKLVITISSRGIVPLSPESRNGEREAAPGQIQATTANRRGLGLNMIKTLMDEVEFERVDDGTSLRMTKYLRS